MSIIHSLTEINNMDTENSQYFIRELNIFSKLPLSEKQIIYRVKKGENIRLVDLHLVRQTYQKLTQAFPQITFYLDLKRLIAKEMLEVLKEEGGSHFEIATLEELKILLKRGIPAEQILFTHPTKEALEIKKAFRAGVRKFVSDSKEDLELLKRYAPKSYVWFHILSQNHLKHGKGDFNKSFGLAPLHAKKLIHLARQFHLKPKGLSFHSEIQNTTSLEYPIKTAGQIFKSLKEEGITLDSLIIGGDFPLQAYNNLPLLTKFSKSVNSCLKKYFQQIKLTETIIKPGHFVSGMAGVTIGRVINVKQSETQPQQYIVTLSTGGLNTELTGPGLEMNFYFEGKNKHPLPFPKITPLQPAFLFNKTSLPFSNRIFDKPLKVPADLQSGHFAVFKGTGAYERDIASLYFKSTNLIFDSKKKYH